ncbi:hypothetical protein [Burkholderia sp. A9]|nr:hypothetical protein [Burkholderia sp. A9]
MTFPINPDASESQASTTTWNRALAEWTKHIEAERVPPKVPTALP